MCDNFLSLKKRGQENDRERNYKKMSNDRRTRAERISSILRDIDSLTVEARQLAERIDKLNRRLTDLKVQTAHFFNEEGNKK